MNWIESRGLSKIYGKREVLRGIDLEVGDGINLISGENGSGKSTLISILAGLTPKTSGNITILDHDPMKQSKEIMKRVYFTPEAPIFFHSDIVDEFLYAHMNLNGYTKENLSYFLDTFGIGALVHSHFQSLSMGERELIMDAAALATGKEYFIMDEPNSNIDTSKRATLSAEILKMANKNKSSFLIVTHVTDNILNISNRIYSLKNGMIKSEISTEKGFDEMKNICVKLRAFSISELKETLSVFSPIITGNEITIHGQKLHNILFKLSPKELSFITNIDVSVETGEV